MNEFVNREFEIRESYEIDGFVERATKLLPQPTEPEGPRLLSWTTFDTDPSKRLKLQLGMGTITNDRGTWLCASERLENPEGDHVNVTKYLVHIEHRIFLVKCERVELSQTTKNKGESTDTIKMELDLGMYVPSANDWDRLSWIIDQAQEFHYRKKGADLARLTKSVQNLIDNTDELS